MMKIYPGNAQHIGTRKEQQDAFGISDITDNKFLSHGGVLAVVADGMGGLAEGGKASRLAVKTFLEAYSSKTVDETIEEVLERSILETNEAVHSLALELDEKNNFGTTLIAAVAHKTGIYWIYAGDSRIYLTDGQALTQLTEDHVYGRKLQKAAEKGLVDADIALSHPDREALTSYIGDEAISEIGKGFYSGPLPENLSLLLCTDGLFKFISEKRIIACYSENPRVWAQKLIDTVLKEKNPSQDNVTAVCLKVGEPQIRTQSIKNTRKKKKRKMFLALSLLLLVLIAAGWGAYRIFAPSKSIEISSSKIASQDISSADPLPGTENQKTKGNGSKPEVIIKPEDMPTSEDTLFAVPVKEEKEEKNQTAPKKDEKIE